MFEKLYDLMVYLTTNYSNMPKEFQKEFPEKECVLLRQIVFNIISFDNDDE